MLLRSALVIIAGLAIAGGSAWLARGMLVSSAEQQANAPALPEQQFGTVVVALADIGFGQEIMAEMLTTQAWPVESIPEGAFLSLEAVTGSAGQAPRSARRAISAGELLMAAKVSEFGEKVSIQQTRTPGTRAMTIQVDAVSGVAGFVKPGDRVDIVLTETRSGDLRARTIMQNIRVVGIDQSYAEDVEGAQLARTMTVEVTPEDGQRLALAQRAGALSLTLRSGDGTDTAPLEAMSLSDLLDGAAVDLPEPTDTAAKRTVTIRRGSDAEIIELNN